MDLLTNLVESVKQKGKIIMKKRKKNYFVKAHEIVKTWARQVLAGDKQMEEVPDLHNLRAIVREIIAEEKAKEEAQKELGQAVNKED